MIGGGVATVEHAGRAWLWGNSWSLDWWVGADDRWYRPAEEAGVRQRRLADSPVVETFLRVPGGDAIHRAYGVRLGDGPTTGDMLVVEVENRSKLPFAVALVVGAARSVSVAAGKVAVNGALGVWASRPPLRLALGRGEESLFSLVSAGHASEVTHGELKDADGSAGAVLMWPIPHGTTLRVLVRLAAEQALEGSGQPSWPVVPDADQVARGWRRQEAAGARLDLPDASLGAALHAARAELLLGLGRLELAGDPSAAQLVGAWRAARAADWLGHPEAAEAVLADLADLAQDDLLAHGVLLAALSEHVDLCDDQGLLERSLSSMTSLTSLPEVVTGLDRILRKGGNRFGPLDRWCCLFGLQGAARLLDALGQPRAAGKVSAAATKRRRQLVAATSPPWAWADLVPPDLVHDMLTSAPPEPLPNVELAVAAARLTAGDPTGWVRLRNALRLASPTWTFADNDAGPVLAGAARNLIVADSGPTLDLLVGWQRGWRGQPIEAHRLPTRFGRLSFVVRWHDERPALLWELEPKATAGAVVVPTLRAPGLDPTWSSGQTRGEALLAPCLPSPGDGAGSGPRDAAHGSTDSFS